MIVTLLFSYALIYWGFHLMCGEPISGVEHKVLLCHQERNGEGDGETQVDGFAWAFHGLTKD